ncbi:hypothetical protein GQ600_13914 [Phytophthora cactorum]|nr:hypothetical protein GQ600_13914 [Phytophthora cactorum]
MLCYRISYPGKLSRIRKQFGRSDSACSRIITDTCKCIALLVAGIVEIFK